MMFAYDSNEEHLKEMKDVLTKHFAKKVDDEMDVLWNEGKVTMDVIEEWGEEHMRTPYKWNESFLILTAYWCAYPRIVFIG